MDTSGRNSPISSSELKGSSLMVGRESSSSETNNQKQHSTTKISVQNKWVNKRKNIQMNQIYAGLIDIDYRY